MHSPSTAGDGRERLAMARVEWTRRTPDEIEAVLGIMLLREFPNGQRIRPARGDNGIDVYVPNDDGWVVYQIKSFTEALTSSHKRQITKSWERFRDFVNDNKLRTKAWYVVLPLNPTRPEIEWLNDLTAGTDFDCEWRGLDFCEGLVARYPEVVDYYLFDGRDRLQEVVRTLLAAAGWAGGTETDPFSPSDAYPSLEQLHEALNTFDPHYYFDFEVSTLRDGEHPRTPAEAEGLVAAVTRTSGGRAVTFRIFARFIEAPIERPVPGFFSPKIEPGTPAALAWEEFLTYGIPVEELAVSRVSIDLPGGLGADAADAFVRLGPASPDAARPFALTMDVLDQDGVVLATTNVNINAATVGMDGKGIALSGSEEAGVFNLDLRLHRDVEGLKFNLSANEVTGRRPADVLPGLDVLLAFEPGRLLRLSLKDGPPLAEPAPIPEALPGQAQSWRIRRVCAALAIIQRHTLSQVEIPDLTVTTNDQARAWVDAAQLLSGESLSMTWNEAVIVVDPAALPAVDSVAPLEVAELLRVDIAGQEIDLGRKVTSVHARVVAADAESGKVRVVPGDHDTMEIRSA
jgi:hypothetical protein